MRKVANKQTNRQTDKQRRLRNLLGGGKYSADAYIPQDREDASYSSSQSWRRMSLMIGNVCVYMFVCVCMCPSVCLSVCVFACFVLGSFRESHSDERLRQVLGVHLHRGAS